MKCWEYKAVDVEMPAEETVEQASARLNAFGADGWEPAWAPLLFSTAVPFYRFWLKREIPDA